MTQLKASEFDALSNELSFRDLTDEEVAALEAKAANKAERDCLAAEKAAAKAALLERLGITADEAALLLG